MLYYILSISKNHFSRLPLSASIIMRVGVTSGSRPHIYNCVPTLQVVTLCFHDCLFFFLRSWNFFCSGRIGLKFETQILDQNRRRNFFSFFDATSKSWVTVESPEIGNFSHSDQFELKLFSNILDIYVRQKLYLLSRFISRIAENGRFGMDLHDFRIWLAT